MRFWSEGLGERQLVMNLGKSHIKRLDEVMLLSGVVDSPAPWEYEVKINRADWAKILDTAATPEAIYSDTLELDLATVEPSLAGPRRPQDRVALGAVKASFLKELPSLVSGKAAAKAP